MYSFAMLFKSLRLRHILLYVLCSWPGFVSII